MTIRWGPKRRGPGPALRRPGRCPAGRWTIWPRRRRSEGPSSRSRRAACAAGASGHPIPGRPSIWKSRFSAFRCIRAGRASGVPISAKSWGEVPSGRVRDRLGIALLAMSEYRRAGGRSGARAACARRGVRPGRRRGAAVSALPAQCRPCPLQCRNACHRPGADGADRRHRQCRPADGRRADLLARQGAADARWR